MSRKPGSWSDLDALTRPWPAAGALVEVTTLMDAQPRWAWVTLVRGESRGVQRHAA